MFEDTMMVRPDRITHVYAVAFAVFFVIVVSTPYWIRSGISFIPEEHLEIIVLVLLSSFGFLVYRKYARYMLHRQETFNDMVRHIGALNLQVEQVQQMMRITNMHPTSREEMMHVLNILCNTILGIVNVDWVLLRAVETNSLRTEIEKIKFRADKDIPYPGVSNKDISEGTGSSTYQTFTYRSSGVTRLGCAVPPIKLTDTQRTLLQTIVNNAGMIYLTYRFNNKDVERKSISWRFRRGAVHEGAEPHYANLGK